MGNIDKMARYAQASIGEHEYRWTVRGNADCPGHVDVLSEEWDGKEKRWRPFATIECIPLEVLEWLTKRARTVVRIEDGTAAEEEGA